MTEEHDSRIAELYRQSSQETPPARLDGVVLEMARKSVRRRRVFSPFGNHWAAGGAVVGVVMLSVLLVMTLPPQPDSYRPGVDRVAPSSDAPAEMRKEAKRLRTLSPESPADLDEKPEMPAAPRPRFDFNNILPEMEVVAPESSGARFDKREQRGEAVKQLQAPASTAAAVPQATYYLQVGSFREKGRAVGLQRRLAGLGYRCEIEQVRIDNAEVYHRVRVGPFTSPEALDESKQKLEALGIETRTLDKRE